MPDERRFQSQRAPIRPDRIRRIDRGGFVFIPNRFLHEGFLAALTQTERSLYFFLVVAGDRNGVSYYHYDRICSTLELSADAYVKARNSLIDKDLLAFDGTRFQVLSLPSKPVVTQPANETQAHVEHGDHLTAAQHVDVECDDRATIGQQLRQILTTLGA